MNYSRLITNILDQYNITYWTEGKNVSKDSINVRCPFYDCGDHSNHMGIFTDTLKFHCWKCNRKGHITYLLKLLTGLSEKECIEIVEEEKLNLGYSSNQIDNEPKRIKELITPLPQHFELIREKTHFPLLDRYIKRRKLTRSLLVAKGCGICRVGEYMNRLIIPVYHEGVQVSFVAADLTGKADKKYINAGSAMENYLYGYDGVQSGGVMVIVEGTLDQWRVGTDSAAILHSYVSDIQKSLIVKKHPQALIFCLDGDAYWHARDEATYFEPFINQVEVIHMPFEEDPDSLGTEEVWTRIMDILFSTEEDKVHE